MKKVLLGLLISIATFTSVKASHQVAGDIGYTCLDSTTNLYEFYVYFYRDCDGISAPTGLTVGGTSSCGNVNIPMTLVDLDPNDPNEMGYIDTLGLCDSYQTTCNGGTYPGVRIYQYVGQANVTPCSDWVFCDDDCCRNGAPNFPPLTATTNYTGNSIAYTCTMNNADGTCDDSPIWNAPPRAYVCQGILTYMDNGANDPDGDSLVFELVNAADGCGGGTITYNAPFSATYPLTTVSATFPFDPTTGQAIFTPAFTPGVFEVTAIAVKIYSYRAGVLKSTVFRDMQIVTLQDCDPLDAVSQGVSAIGNETIRDGDTIKVCAGDTLDFSVLVLDAINKDEFTLKTSLTKDLDGLEFTFDSTTAAWIIEGKVYLETTIDHVGFYPFTIEARNSGCPVSIEKIFELYLDIIPSTKAYVTPDTTCFNSDSVIFEAKGGNNFNWYKVGGAPAGLDCDNCATTFASPQTTTEYVVISDLQAIYPNAGCTDRDTVTLTVVPPISILGNPEICFGDTSFLSLGWAWEPGEHVSYIWNDDEDEDDTTYITNIAGQYTLLVTDTVDYIEDTLVCILTDTVEVVVINCPVSIPNIFTPNNDGFNDKFYIKNIENEAWNLTIFGRWGREILEERFDYQNDWDGGDLNDGTYYYTLTNQDGSILTEYKGWVQIAR